MSSGQKQLLNAALEARRRRAEEQRQRQETPVKDKKPTAEPTEEVVALGDLVETVEVEDTKLTSQAEPSKPKGSTRRTGSRRSNSSRSQTVEKEDDITGILTSESPKKQRPSPSTSKSSEVNWNETDIRQRLQELFNTVRVGPRNIVVFGAKELLANADADAIVAMVEYQLSESGINGMVVTGNRPGRYRVVHNDNNAE